MEPFELKVHQVTFEEGDVNAVYDADSSGSIVNCEYDSFDVGPGQAASGDQLRQQSQDSPKPHSGLRSPPGAPLTASRPRATYLPAWGQYGGEESPTHEQFLVNPNESFLYTAYTTTTTTATSAISNSSRKNGGRVTEASHHTLAQISVNTGAVAKHLSRVKKRQARTTLVKSTPTVVTTMPSEKATGPPAPQEGATAPDDPADSSFETVAEALKLQWSVIGNKNIAPAPPEVVAQIVADAERRLRSNANTNASPAGSAEATAAGVVSPGAFPVGEAILDDVSSLSSLSSTRKSSSSSITADVKSPAGNGQESPGPVSARVTSPSPQPSAVQPASPAHQPSPAGLASPARQPGATRVATPSPQPGAGQQRELIRIPAESMVRTTEKSKTTWFGGKEGQVSKAGAAAEESRSPPGQAPLSQEARGGVPAGSKKSGPAGIRSRGNEGGRADLDGKKADGEKGHQDDAVSVSSMSSDLDMERLAGTDSESLNSVTSPTSPGGQVSPSPTQFPPLPSQLPLLPLPKLGPLFTPISKPAPSPAASAVTPGDAGQARGDPRLAARLEELMRERAKLSGQLEVLSQENQSTLQERAQLQAQLASLRLKLMAAQNSRSGPETQALRREVSELQQSRAALEASLADSQRLGEERLEEVRGLQEELAAASEAGDKLALRLKELRDELRSRDGTIQALKGKVAELYVEVQTAMQAKMEADQEARTATNDVASLQSAKDWYGQQLALAHEVRSKLQRELTLLQAQASAHGSVVERLRLQNGQLRSALAEAQQRALREKEALARHLEVIETDMMEREAAFQEIQRERRLIEDTYSVHAQTAEEEKSRIALLMQSNKELEARLDKGLEDMKKKQSHIFSMETEQIELMKKLALAQESLQEKENSCEELRQRLVEVEAGLGGLQESLAAKERELQGLREERASKEIALAAALQEKASVDRALETLQADMGKVEKSFKQMRSELGVRLAELEKVSKEKTALTEELDRVQKELDIKRRSYDTIHRDFTGKTDALNTLRGEQQMVEDQVVALRKQVAELQTSQKTTLQEKAAAEAALAESQARLAAVEHQLQQLQASGVQPQRQALQGSEASNHVYTDVMSNHVDTAAPTEVTSAVVDRADSASDERVLSLQEENRRLQQQLAELGEELGRLVVVEREGREKAAQELSAVRAELCEAKQSWSEEVAGLTSRLQEALGERQRLQTEMEMLQRRQEVGAMQQQDQLRTELQRLMSELKAAQLGQQKAEEGLERLRVEKEAQVAALQAELERLVAMEAAQQEREQQHQQLALELETERGRIEGLLQNNSALKQHVGKLEEALAGRESALQELHGQLGSSLEQANSRDQKYMARICAMEEALAKEKEGQRALRKQIGQKMTENSRLKKQSAAARAEQEAVEGELGGTREALQGAQAALEASRQEARTAQAQLTAAQAHAADLQAQMEKVKRQLEDNLARQPFIQDQIQNLQWQLEQKGQEVAMVTETMRLAEERQQQELEGLRRQLEEKQGEVDELQQQLTASRQEKLNQRQRVTQLRGALKATVHHHKLSEKIRSKRKTSGGSRDQGTQVDAPGEELVIPPLPIDLAEVEKLLEDTAVRPLDSKPLDNLKSCLSSLRSEITGLQEKMDVHTNTVHTTTQSWRSVESQVQELTEVMRTIANTINETKNAGAPTVSIATELEESEGVETV